MRRQYIVVGAMALALAIGSVDPGHAAESFDAVDRSAYTTPGSANADVGAASDITGSGAFDLSARMAQEDLALDDDFAYASSAVQAVKRFTLAPGEYTAKGTVSNLNGTATREGKAGAGASVQLNLLCEACNIVSMGSLSILDTSPLRDASVSNGAFTAVMRFTVPEGAPQNVGISTWVTSSAAAFTGVSANPNPSGGIYLHGGGASSVTLTGTVSSIVVNAVEA